MRRKSFNLISLILAVMLIILLVVLSVYFINRTKNSDNKSSKEDSTSTETASSESSSKATTLDSDFLNSLKNIEENGTTTSEENNNTSENTNANNNNAENEENQNESQSDEYTLNFNNHTYKFKKPIQATVTSNTNVPEIEINYPDYNFKFLYNTDSSTSFEKLKSSPDLKNLIESKYKVTVSDSLKTGTLNNLNIIICSISDNGTPAYLLFTPLNDSEVASVKIYNTKDTQSTIDDFSKPLDEISSIISNVD